MVHSELVIFLLTMISSIPAPIAEIPAIKDSIKPKSGTSVIPTPLNGKVK